MANFSLAQRSVPSDLVALHETVESCLNITTRLSLMAHRKSPELVPNLISDLKIQLADARAKLAAVFLDFQREGPPLGIVVLWLKLIKQEWAIGPFGGKVAFADMSIVRDKVIEELIVGQWEEEILGETGLAIEAAIEFATRVFESCCLIADPLNNIPIDGAFRELDPECISKELDAVLLHLRSIGMPDLKRVRIGIADEISRAAEKRKSKAGITFHSSSEFQRMYFDDFTNTITLDLAPFSNLDPVSYSIFKGLFSLHVEKRNVVSQAELQRLPGLKGKSIGRELKKLPKELLALVKSKPGAGRWIDLPPL
jgi:hypothetical protein